MAYDLAQINRRIAEDPAGFVRACEKDYSDKVQYVTDKIRGNISKSPIVLMSGPSGSGKTTTAKKIESRLDSLGINSHTISLDNYFLTVDPETAPRTPKGEIDYESPDCLDITLLNEHFSKLSKGEEVEIPHFDFTKRARRPDKAVPMRLGKDDIVIFEGIHALNDRITNEHESAFKLYINARSDVMLDDAVCFKSTWLRLVRRSVRDNFFRGSDAQYTLKMWANIRRGEKLNISPFKSKADYIFDSSMPYEVSVMKRYAEPIFTGIPDGTERFEELQKILPAFERFADIDPDLVPPDSILREFIGGGIYKY